MRELESPDVAGAHHVRPGAEVRELPVPEKRDRLARGNVLQDVEFELGGNASGRERGQLAPFRHGQRIGAGNLDALENMVRLHLALHLLLDPREVLGGNPVAQFHIVIKPVLHRRPRRELRIGPDFQDRRRQHMRGGVADAFEFGHGVFPFRRKSSAASFSITGIPPSTG